MMQQMRANTKWIMIAAALAFVGLMVFEWGMDMSGQSAGGVGQIGRVDGTPVMYDNYNFVYQNLYSQWAAAQAEPITSSQNRQIEDQAWDQLVTQILIQHELERREIKITAEEIRQAARFNPAPEFLSSPAFLTDGAFDLGKYQSFLATQTDDFLLSLEAYYRDLLPREKLLRQLGAGVYIPDADLWARYREENEQADVRFIALNPNERYSDDEVDITDREIRDYFDERGDDFQRVGVANVRAVVLDKTPTIVDTTAAGDRAAEIRQRILDGEDFAEVAQIESADPGSAALGGDLGTVWRGQMVTSVDSTLFAASTGELSPPVQSDFGFHVIEVTEKVHADSVKARHILVPIERTDDSEITLLTQADSLETLGQQMTLDQAGRDLGLQVQTIQLTETFPFIAGAGQVEEGMDWALEEALEDEVSPVFETAGAFYILELIDSTPAGPQSLEEATPEIERILRTLKKFEMAKEEAVRMEAEVTSGATLDDLAENYGLTVQNSGLFNRIMFVSGLGRQNEAIGTAFGLETGELSGAVSTADNNVFFIQQSALIPADSAAWDAQKEDQRARLVAVEEQTRLSEWLEAAKALARIVDQRDVVLQDPDDLEDLPLPRGGIF